MAAKIQIILKKAFWDNFILFYLFAGSTIESAYLNEQNIYNNYTTTITAVPPTGIVSFCISISV